MLILNATSKVKSVMTDRGDLITINPGEVSRIIIASRNIIISAITLGSPSEIGIILTGSFEMDIAKNITGSVPYLYTDVEEAKSKLLDPAIDYKANLNASKVNAYNEDVIKSQKAEIESLNSKISELTKSVTAAKSKDTVITELDTKVQNLTTITKEDYTKIERLNSDIATSAEKIRALTVTSNELSEQLDAKSKTISELNNTINSLTNNLNEERAKSGGMEGLRDELTSKCKSIEDLHSELNTTKAELEYITEKCNAYKTSAANSSAALAEAVATIDSMKVEFNKACTKFGLVKDKSGEWIQIGQKDA